MLKNVDSIGLVDTHCHIIPNIDDGSSSLDESLQMARVAVASGVSTIVATPHHGVRNIENRADLVDLKVQLLNAELMSRNIPLTILSGQEVRVRPWLIEELYEGTIRTLNSTRYILLELPSYGVPDYFQHVLHELSILQMTPVIAHPERNYEFLRNPSNLIPFIDQGALCQVTSQSIMGLFGYKVQKLAIELCKNNWVHLVASDAHNMSSRPGMLKQGYQRLEKKVGKQRVQMYKANAVKLIENEFIGLAIPSRMRKKNFFQSLYS